MDGSVFQQSVLYRCGVQQLVSPPLNQNRSQNIFFSFSALSFNFTALRLDPFTFGL
jgi:hypothetical protein